MTESEAYTISFQRPKNFFLLSAREQWDIDKQLGILDWKGGCLHDNKQACSCCNSKFVNHYKFDTPEQK